MKIRQFVARRIRIRSPATCESALRICMGTRPHARHIFSLKSMHFKKALIFRKISKFGTFQFDIDKQ